MQDGLTDAALAQATGLELVTVRRYLDLYRPDLLPVGTGRMRRWDASCIETLQLIHQLPTAGYTQPEVESMLGGKPLPPPTLTEPPPETEPTPEPGPVAPPRGRDPRPEYTYEAETAALRERLRAHSPRVEQRRLRRSWWQALLWWRRP